MAAGLVVPVSGPYYGSWGTAGGPQPLGTMNDDGFELQCTFQGQEVNETDAYGMTLVEGVNRGQNWRIRLRGLEWNKTGLLSLVQSFGSTAAFPQAALNPALAQVTVAGPPPTVTNMGQRWTTYTNTMVLTSLLGAYPPAIPTSLTSTSAAIAPNSQTAWNLTSKVREMPLELVLLPYSATVGTNTYYLPFTST